MVKPKEPPRRLRKGEKLTMEYLIDAIAFIAVVIILISPWLVRGGE